MNSKMTILEIFWNWIYACGMGAVTALALIGIPTLIIILVSRSRRIKANQIALEKSAKERELAAKTA